jgi:hypothetical protein
VIIEGIGEGPIRTLTALDAATKSMKMQGNVELWNYLGSLSSAANTDELLCKVWRLHGVVVHPLFCKAPPYPLQAFIYDDLEEVGKWLNGMYTTHTLILSGDGDLGKTCLVEALLCEVCPEGCWFLEGPDDCRELQGQIKPTHGLDVDEIELASFPPNQIKKLLCLEKTRRVKYRHFNATIPPGCARIYSTNSGFEQSYPKMKNKHGRNGVMRRQLFQVVSRDVRRQSAVASASTSVAPVLHSSTSGTPAMAWREKLQQACAASYLDKYFPRACRIAKELGVALSSEITQVGEEIARRADMKQLERGRFLAQLRG